MDDEPKTPAELKEIRLNRGRPGCRRHQGDGRYRGSRYRDTKADRDLARGAIGTGSRRRENPPERRPRPNPRKRRRPEMSKEDRDRADARFNKAAQRRTTSKAGGNDRDAASKAVLDNMARLKPCGWRAKPPHRPRRSRSRAPSRQRRQARRRRKRARSWRIGWPGGRAAATGPRLRFFFPSPAKQARDRQEQRHVARRMKRPKWIC